MNSEASEINVQAKKLVYGGTVVNLYQWFKQPSIFNGSVTLEYGARISKD